MTQPMARLNGRAERGVTLVVVLLILLVVTVLGIGGAQLALLGERSTRYDRDYLIASQAAEAALMDAEFDIRGTGSRAAQFTPDIANSDYLFVAGCGGAGTRQGLCNPTSAPAKPAWDTVNFLDDSANAHSVEFGAFTGRVYAHGDSGIRPERAPRYVIDWIFDTAFKGNAGGTSPPKLYRITAIGFGPRKEVQVVLQTTFRKEKP